MARFDYLIVGAGLFGATFAREMTGKGKQCVVIDRREHIAGNIYTREENGIQVHQYGAHIFHTSNKRVWEYVNQFAEFNHYVNSPVARYQDELYNLPFNMNTFSKMWGIVTPKEAKAEIARQIEALHIEEPKNLEEQALSLVGTDVYEKLVKGYTEKQWGRDCKELPAFIIKRLPLRFTYDNNYFNDRFQGIPMGGYTQMVQTMLEGIPVITGVEFKDYVEPDCGWNQLMKRASKASDAPVIWMDKEGNQYDKVLYTGLLDELFDYAAGTLEYRSLFFETETLPEEDNYQGNAVVNYTERDIPYTRIIEHKHFEFGKGEGTVITREYPADWQPGKEPYYPMNNEKNDALSMDYQKLAGNLKSLLVGGRLGLYKYYDMDKAIEAALLLVEKEIEN